jgi:hypothetical protein
VKRTAAHTECFAEVMCNFVIALPSQNFALMIEADCQIMLPFRACWISRGELTRNRGLFPSIINCMRKISKAQVGIGHVRAVHRAQRHAHRSRNHGLHHPTLTQQHHLLALRSRYLPPQRSAQPSAARQSG